MENKSATLYQVGWLIISLLNKIVYYLQLKTVEIIEPI
jgi:hypothetical protein